MKTKELLELISKKDILERTFRFAGYVDSDSTNKILEKILGAFVKDPEKEIVLYIESGGGQVSSALSFYDTIKIYRPKLITIATGSCMSAAVQFLLAGNRELRMATKRTHFLLHPVKNSTSGTNSELEERLKGSQDFEKMMQEIVVIETGLNKKKVSSICSNEQRTSVEEAKRLGLISHII